MFKIGDFVRTERWNRQIYFSRVKNVSKNSDYLFVCFPGLDNCEEWHHKDDITKIPDEEVLIYMLQK